MKLSRAAWSALVLAVLLTIWSHAAVLGTGGEIGLNRGTLSSLLPAVATPRVVSVIAQHLVVLLFAYGLLFLWIVALARQRRPPRHAVERDVHLLLLAWAVVCWLGLRLHTAFFPHSVWTGIVWFIQEPSGSQALDVLATSFLLWRTWEMFRPGAWGWAWRSAGVWALACVLCAAMLGLRTKLHETPDPTSNSPSPRTVVVIGLDSVRRDVLLSASKGRYPNLAALRDASFFNANVVTPLPRTFPAWVSILTGLGPQQSGALENHAPQGGIRRNASMAWDFRRAGYRTVYATDETRFSHITPEFGFNEVVGPPMGAADFVLGIFGDDPLVNALVQLPYADLLLPALAGNRAFGHAYRPEHFVGRLSRALGAAGETPTFIAVHLCTVHWPFRTMNRGVDGNREANRDSAYHLMMRELDQQVGDLLKSLKRLGYVHDNTLLVVLADHGEGLPSDLTAGDILFTKPNGEKESLVGRVGGHGASVLSPSEWQVFAMFSGATANGPITAGQSTALASLEDVKPTVLRLVGLSPPTTSVEAGDDVARMGPRTVARIQTAWRPWGLDLTQPNEARAVDLAMRSYAVLPDGRIELKPEVLDDIAADKDYGVTDGANTLAVIWIERKRLVVQRKAGDTHWSGELVTDPPRSSAVSPLLPAACDWPEMRALMPAWCLGRETMRSSLQSSR